MSVINYIREKMPDKISGNNIDVKQQIIDILSYDDMILTKLQEVFENDELLDELRQRIQKSSKKSFVITEKLIILIINMPANHHDWLEYLEEIDEKLLVNFLELLRCIHKLP